MAVVIRLKRVGAKKDPKFRIVVADSRAARDGRFVDEIGSYNAQPAEAEFRVDGERARYWLSVGAQPSDQVRSLFKKAGIAMPVRATRPKKKKLVEKPVGKKAARKPTAKKVAQKKRVAARKAAPRKKSTKKAAAKKAGKK
jgi:small subunit ribosomal protein S16